MTPTEFAQRLFQASGPPQLTGLANDLAEDARYPARLAMQSLSSNDAASGDKAKNVLADLGALSLVPLAASQSFSDMDTELWVMRTMTEELVNFRMNAASVIKNLLTNIRPATPAAPQSTQQIPPGTRVCDLAYVLLQRILHLTTSISAFFALPAADRDKQIKEFQKSRAFRAAFESPQ